MLTTCLKTDNLPFTIMGLCPLLLVTTSATNGMAMASIFLINLILSSLILSAIKQFIANAMRLPMILLLTAAIATLIDLGLSAFHYEWHLTLGIYVPLLAMNCLILVNAEKNILRNNFRDAMSQTLMLGLSVVGLLFVVGLIREILSGLIFDQNGFVMFEMAPGVFLALGLVVALVNYLNIRTTKIGS